MKLSNLERLPFITKLIIAVILDVLDFTVFRVPGIGTIYDAFVTGVLIILVGPIGVVAGWEVVGDPTDQVDAEIPTATAIVVAAKLMKNK